MTKYFISLACFLASLSITQGQSDMSIPQRFDYGKMWTFENPPKEWFKEAYNFEPEVSWYDDIRKSSLKFGTWCSASFVSEQGLIMTNHHCSQNLIPALQKEGENLDINGFYASTLAEERKSQGLFVEQLMQLEDVSERILPQLAKAKNDTERKVYQDSVIAQLIREYQLKAEWKGLRIQAVSFYSGGKFSLYGYKKYGDIRLVLLPEKDLASFGGDPDNFTYPRYSLDFTFWRAYDENGIPMNTSANFLKFKIEGAQDGEPVFVVGNPGSTERYRTNKQQEYDRDFRYPPLLEFMNNRFLLLTKENKANPSQTLQNQIDGLTNGIKAITGIYKGLNNPELIQRKKATETEIRNKTNLKAEDYWLELGNAMEELKKYVSASTLLGPTPTRGKVVNLMHSLAKYEKSLVNSMKVAELDKIKSEIREQVKDLHSEKELAYLTIFLHEIKKYEHPLNTYVDKILKGKQPDKAAERMLAKTDFTDTEKLEKIFNKSQEKFAKFNDPILDASRILVPKYTEAVNAFQSIAPRRRVLEAKIANAVFQVKGNHLPPDTTSTLRISDGIVKGYDYNGTKAPYKTTFYGLYDRYFSNDKKIPWSIHPRWENPPVELLRSPFTFVSTNDIIGGNSGSPIINKNKEIVGLVFDGNIESLPGNFIYDSTYNRTVNVHSSGIMAAVKYIYKADRIVNELTGQ